MFDSNQHKNYTLETGQASPFAILLAALLGVLVLAVLCTGGVLFFRGDDDVADVGGTSTAIAQANATTLAQNAQVTQTIAAMETEAARPTATATNTPQPTATTTNTPQPSPTAVIEEAEATPTPSLFGTSIFDTTPTPIGGAGDGTGTDGGALPDTGIGLGAALAAALGLLVLLVGARRLRTG